MAGIADSIVFGLAVWRGSIMITKEDGPFDVFSRMRENAGVEHNGVLAPWSTLNTAGKLLQCPYCLSMWLALALIVLQSIHRPLYQVVIMSLFGSAVTVAVEDYYASNVNT